jgi:hypothetical protein
MGAHPGSKDSTLSQDWAKWDGPTKLFNTLQAVDTRQQFSTFGPISRVCAYRNTWLVGIEVTYGYGAETAKAVLLGDQSVVAGSQKECVDFAQGECIKAVAANVGLFLESLLLTNWEDNTVRKLFADDGKSGLQQREALEGACLGAISGWVGEWFEQTQVTGLQLDWVPEEKVGAG